MIVLSSVMLAWLHSTPILRSCSRLEDSRSNDPSGRYPAPVTAIEFPSTYTCVTVISFLVRVPVLSEQMTLTDHSVSTDGSFLMSASLRTMRLTQRLRAIVTTAGKPSGIAATASATDAKNADDKSKLCPI